MSASPNPLAAMIMSALQSRTAAGGGMPGQTMPGQGGGLPGGADPSAAASGAPDAGDQYAQQVASLKRADPSMLLRQVTKIKQIWAVLGVHNLESMPNVSGQMLKMVPQFDRVIKEIQQAANVNSAVRPPLGLGAAQPPQDSSGGM